MARTPDRQPGASDEEAIVLESTGAATVAGEIRYDGTSFSLRDSVGTFDPRSGGGGITEGQHEGLDTLVHELSETAYEEITRSGGQVTSDIWWTDNTKTTKVRETLITRSGGQVSTIVVKQYNGAGSLVKTLTGTVTRSGGQVESIDWVET